MRKSVIILLVVIMSLLLVTAVSAQDVPAPGGPFSTAFNIQNLSSTDSATCSIIFYDANGAGQLTVNPDPIAPGDIAEFFTGAAPVNALAAGQYSAVISCNQPVASVVNYSDADSGASHGGLSDSEVGTTFSAPAVYNNFYSYYTNIVVQNATSNPIDITLDILGAGGVVVDTVTKFSVPGYAAVVFSQEGNANLNSNISYSARITGTGNVASVVNIYGKGTPDGQLYSYNPFASGSKTAYAPLIMNNYYGFNSALTVQNTSSTDTATIKVSYSNSTSETQDVGPGSSYAFANFENTSFNTNTLYSATIESYAVGSTSTTPDGPDIVAIVNQSNSINRAATYNAVTQGTTVVRAPILFKSFYGFDSSVTCQNIGTGPTDIDITYANGGYTSKIGTAVAAGNTADLLQFTDSALASVPTNYQTSATITATEPIVCVINQNKLFNSGGGNSTEKLDLLFSYNGIQ